MSTKHLETMTGKGLASYESGETVSVEYRLELLQEMIDFDAKQGHSQLPGLQILQGRVLPVSHPIARTFTLELSDGRKFKLAHFDSEGSIGLIAA
jgi:hypothetical protein